jgi:HAD superfamily hydrolase (TIGR01509 family)
MDRKRVRGILLDIDGTLLDSNDAHARAWVEALADAGIASELAHLRRLIGKGGDKVLPEVAGLEADSKEGKKISEHRSALFLKKYLPQLGPFPGARDLVLRLKKEGIKPVVATSAKKEELSLLLRQAGIEDLLHEKATSSDAKSSKPDPDIIEAAVKRADIPPDELMMLGDTPYDVEASTKAGVAAIALRCGGWTDPDLTGAVAVYDGPADLLAHFESSPLAR